LCILLVQRRKSVTEDRSLIVNHQFSPSVMLSHPLLMCWVKQCKYYRCRFGIFTNSNSVLWQPALSFLHYPHISIKWWWIFMGETGFSHQHSVTLRILRCENPPLTMSLLINFILWITSTWPTNASSVMLPVL
jgi:hypothetical protein